MKPSRRLLFLLAILALVGALVVFDAGPGRATPGIVAARAPRQAPTATPSPEQRIDSRAGESSPLLALRPRRPGETSPAAGFDTHDWTPPPPPPPPPAPPPPPQAPPLPFAFLGKQRDGGQWTVFLANQERTYVATEGVLIDSAYRVERIAPPTLTVTYLPLQQTQTLAIGPAE